MATSSQLHDSLRRDLASGIGRQAVAGAGSATVIDFQAAIAQRLDVKDMTGQMPSNRPIKPLSNQPGEQTRGNRTFASEIAYRFAELLREKGILVHVTGSQRDRIAIIPPLNVDESEISLVADACQVAWETIAAEWKPISRSVLR